MALCPNVYSKMVDYHIAQHAATWARLKKLCKFCTQASLLSLIWQQKCAWHEDEDEQAEHLFHETIHLNPANTVQHHHKDLGALGKRHVSYGHEICGTFWSEWQG